MHVISPRLSGQGALDAFPHLFRKPSYLNALPNPGQASLWGTMRAGQSSTTEVFCLSAALLILLCYIRVLATSACFRVKWCHSLGFALWIRCAYIEMCLLSEKPSAFPEMILSALLADAFILSSCVSK